MDVQSSLIDTTPYFVSKCVLLQGILYVFKKKCGKENNFGSFACLIVITFKNNWYDHKSIFTIEHIIFTQAYPVFM